MQPESAPAFARPVPASRAQALRPLVRRTAIARESEQVWVMVMPLAMAMNATAV
jgi:hypothetical protein